MFWPTFIISVSAAIIASQAMISGSFAIISQSQTLGCFPRVKVLHTSKLYEGQVYIPEINFVLGLLCVIVTFGFKTTTNIGNAYGKTNVNPILLCFVKHDTELILCRNLCYFCDGYYNYSACNCDASHMEGEHLADNTLLPGIWFHRACLSFFSSIQIQTRGLPTYCDYSSSANDHGCLALCPRKEILVRA